MAWPWIALCCKIPKLYIHHSTYPCMLTNLVDNNTMGEFSTIKQFPLKLQSSLGQAKHFACDLGRCQSGTTQGKQGPTLGVCLTSLSGRDHCKSKGHWYNYLSLFQCELHIIESFCPFHMNSLLTNSHNMTYNLLTVLVDPYKYPVSFYPLNTCVEKSSFRHF